MKKEVQRVANTLLLIILVCPTTLLSKQEVNFSDAATVEKLITGKSWNCKMVDAYGESIAIYKFNEVNRNKVKGSVKVPHLPVCDSDVLKGKLKKNRLKYMAPNGTPCREVNGFFVFSYNDSGKVEATGSYGIGGTHKRGSYVCSMQ